MDISIFLARVIGLVGVTTVIAILIHYKEFLRLEAEAVKNKIFTYISGFVFLILGALVVVSHSIWSFDWRIIITLLGWMMLLKGVGRIFFPDAVYRLMEKKRNHRGFILGEIVVLCIGLYLLYNGFIIY